MNPGDLYKSKPQQTISRQKRNDSMIQTCLINPYKAME
jgi:hypothetical protein